MRHIQLDDGNSYAVNVNCHNDKVLLQLNDTKDGDQVRVVLTKKEAFSLSHELYNIAFKIEYGYYKKNE